MIFSFRCDEVYKIVLVSATAWLGQKTLVHLLALISHDSNLNPSIMTVGVITEFRHRELGSTLVKKVISVVEQDNDCGAIYLHVITHNSAAIRFYEKLGFFRVKEIKDYYKIEGKNYNCYLYARYFHGKLKGAPLVHICTS